MCKKHKHKLVTTSTISILLNLLCVLILYMTLTQWSQSAMLGRCTPINKAQQAGRQQHKFAMIIHHELSKHVAGKPPYMYLSLPNFPNHPSASPRLVLLDVVTWSCLGVNLKLPEAVWQNKALLFPENFFTQTIKKVLFWCGRNPPKTSSEKKRQTAN